MCFRGWNAIPWVTGSDRLQAPMIRKGEKLESVSWEEAIAFTASALKQISSESGAGSIGVIGSAKTTNEECYSLAKFARSAVGTANVDGPCRFYDASLIPALLQTTGTAAAGVEMNAIAQAGSMLVVGSNTMEQVPHVASRIEDARLNGCKVIVADPRTSRLEAHASLFLNPKPGTDLIWIRALLKIIIDRELYSESASQLPGFEELRSSLADGKPEAAADACGIELDSIVETAEALGKNAPAVVMFGLGVMQQAQSVEIIKALADVALLVGGSVMPLRGQNNAQGACDLGLTNDYLPGYAPLSDAAARQKWETAWDCKIPSEPGRSAVEMIQACKTGEIRAMVVFGENLALSAPNTEESLAALDNLDFFAVSDLYLTETARMADVVFPACSFLEKDGTFTNIERRVQRVRKMLEPVGQSRPDLQIIADLSGVMGKEVSSDPRSIMAEIAANVPQYAAVSYDALDDAWGTPWPVNGAEPRLAPVAEAAVSEEDAEYPFRLIASRVLYPQRTGTMSEKAPILVREYREPYAEMHEDDASELGVRPGSSVRITSRSGSMTRTALLSCAVPRGCVHVPHYHGGDSPNALSSYECDPISGVPVYKAHAVKVEAVQ